MPKITNMGRTPRAFHLASTSAFAEIAKGESVEVTDADLEALNKSKSFEAVVASGDLKIEGGTEKPAKAKKEAA